MNFDRTARLTGSDEAIHSYDIPILISSSSISVGSWSQAISFSNVSWVLHRVAHMAQSLLPA